MSRYDGKKVVVTGGSSGFGLTIAELLLDQGAQVLVTGRSEATLAAAADTLGRGVLTAVSDAASLADVEALAAQVEERFGRFDALFVNAGMAGFAPFADTTEEMFDRVFQVNAKGAFFTVQKLAPLLNPGSGIVLTTSVANVLGTPMVSAYAASKAALRSMTRTLARELLDKDIRVNAVSPGPIDTGILEKSLPAEVAEHTKAQMTQENPMLRFGQPREVATAAIFLAFDATYTTGAEMPVDGGASQL